LERPTHYRRARLSISASGSGMPGIFGAEVLNIRPFLARGLTFALGLHRKPIMSKISILVVGGRATGAA
jgi:hypothetical protein